MGKRNDAPQKDPFPLCSNLKMQRELLLSQELLFL